MILKQRFLNKIYKWQDKTFPTANSSSKVYHLKEEVEELLEEVNKPHIICPENKDLMLEYADCFLLLFGAAKKDGLDLDGVFQAMSNKFEIIKLRKWGKPDKNGVVNHIKE